MKFRIKKISKLGTARNLEPCLILPKKKFCIINCYLTNITIKNINFFNYFNK